MARRAHRQRSQGASRAAAPALAPPSPPGRRRLPPLSLPAVTRATVVSKSVVGQLFEGKPDRRAYPQRRAQTAREEGKRHGTERNTTARGGTRELTFSGCAPCSCFMSLMQSFNGNCEMCPYKLDVLETKSEPPGPDEFRGRPWRCLSRGRCERAAHVSPCTGSGHAPQEQKQPPKLLTADSLRHQPVQAEVLACEPDGAVRSVKVWVAELTNHLVMGASASEPWCEEGESHDSLKSRVGSRPNRA